MIHGLYNYCTQTVLSTHNLMTNYPNFIEGLNNMGTTRNVNSGLQTDTLYESPRPQEPPNEETTSPPPNMIPDESDFLLGYATVPGYVSYRSRSTGSFYIKTLVEKLKKYTLGPR